MDEIVFLTLEQIIVIHDDQIERYGGRHGIRDFALLESAQLRPQSTFNSRDLYSTIFTKAAALIHSLVLNHPFIDGNKRTGLASGIIFLLLNNYELTASNKTLENIVMKIESRKLTIGQISSWLKLHSRPLPILG